ncbi:MAG: dienelactone hydrolase family protein [Chloroflexi bacterium]|nr:dienelactone hydrolase family protein [Chloroflexota bacterium]
MNETQRYLAVEHYEDFQDGLIGRRELFRRLTLILGTSAAASAFVAACGGAPAGTTATAAATAPATAAATTAPTAAPTAAATTAASPAPAVAYATPPPATTTDGITVKTDDPRITAGPQTIKAADGANLIGYLSRPKADGKYPAILVMHENRGLLEHIKDVTRRAATAGFAAVAIDVLSRDGGADKLSDQAAYNAALGRRAPADMVKDFASVLDFMKTQPYVNGTKLGATGFCFGGGTVWHLLNGGVAVQAAAPFYGPVPQDPSGIASTKAAVLGVFAETDNNVNAGMARVEEALKKAATTYKFNTYPGTMHGFHNDTGQRYNADQSRKAWVDAIEWFRKYLG